MYQTSNQIVPNLYLGMIPVTGDEKLFLGGLDIHFVLSMNEEFEVHSTGCLSSLITPERWGELGVGHKLIESADFVAVTIDNLECAADTIAKQLEEGSVYVHCKAGRGRSAMAVVAYLVKHRFKGVLLEDIVAFVKTRRPVININSKTNGSFRVFSQLVLWVQSLSSN